MAGKAQRAAPRPERRPERRRAGGGRLREREQELRREHWLLLGVLGVLAVAAVIVAVGLYITEYRPPRAQVLRVQGTDYNAGQVAGRAQFAVRFEPGAADLAKPEQFVGQVLDRIERDHVLRERAPALVGAVTANDLEQELRTQLGLLPPAPAATVAAATPTSSATPAAGGATATASATATTATTATATATALATMTADERKAYADGLRAVLRNAGISRAEYDAWLTARLLERRLGDKFKAEAGATAAQLRLARIRVADEASANRVREQATGGADFAQLARDSSLDQQTRPGGGELGWRLPELLEPEVRDAVAKLGTGDLAVVRSGRLYDVYKVLEASPARELDAGLAGQLATRKVDDWVKAELVHLRVKRELSADEDAWIREEVGERLQRAVS